MLRAGQIDQAGMVAIGRIIRATAEIEDILELFIGALANLSESQACIFLGRSPISRKLEIAEALAKIRPDKALATYQEAFPDAFRDVLDCRNAVAHGVLIGISEEGEYAFLTTPSGQVKDGSSMRIVISYSAATISNIAGRAEAMIPYLEERLKVETQRAERLQRPLEPHPKAQPQARAKSKRQPQSSPG